MWKLVREGAVGKVAPSTPRRTGIELRPGIPIRARPTRSGRLVDVGVYPLTIVTAIFGPIRLVRATATTLSPTGHCSTDPVSPTGSPDFVLTVLAHESGVVTRLTATFYVGRPNSADWKCTAMTARYTCRRGPSGLPPRTAAAWRRVRDDPAGARAVPGTDWARALVDLADAVENGRPHRASAEHAAHIVEVMNAIETAATDGGTVRFTPRSPPSRWNGLDDKARHA